MRKRNSKTMMMMMKPKMGRKKAGGLMKKASSLVKKHRKVLGKGALYGASLAASVKSGSAVPLMVAKKADSVLFSRRNRSSMGVSQKPTGAKGF